MKVENQKVVTVIYDLYIHGDKPEDPEELMERATIEHPLIYCHGEGMMLPAFEKGLLGLEKDQAFDFVIPFAEAYGEYDEEGVLVLDKKLFCNADGEFDSERVRQGNIIPMNTSDGQIINACVLDVAENEVTIDLNHPFAGEDLHFVGKIIDLRDVTQGELDAIHHKGCGGGCGGCGGGCNKGNCGEGDCGENGCGGCH